tara:strand:+ start:1390 stop:1518 length:129 start_codon:yes stop_codon:yes gene_type:complete
MPPRKRLREGVGSAALSPPGWIEEDETTWRAFGTATGKAEAT